MQSCAARCGHLPGDRGAGSVDATGAAYRSSIRQALLSARWRDPAFDPGQRTFYYARVIEIPMPRWPVHDARAFGY